MPVGEHVVHAIQWVTSVATPTGVYYTGHIELCNVSWLYKIKFCGQHTCLKLERPVRMCDCCSLIWMGINLEADESEFLLRTLGGFSQALSYPRPEPEPFDRDKKRRADEFAPNGVALASLRTTLSDDGSVAWAADILHHLVIRRQIALTPQARKILGRKKFGLKLPAAHAPASRHA